MKPMSLGSTLSEVQAAPTVRRRMACRLCGCQVLSLVLQLTPTPPANAFVSADMLLDEQDAYPLDVFLCDGCGHLQLLDVVNPDVLFRDYVYVSSTSPVFVDHFRRYADQVIETASPPDDALVVEIGSNDGTFLRFFRERGLRVLGVDPALKIAMEATRAGIETMPAFFDADLARQIRQERGPASVVAANNVLAHADDLAGIAAGIRELLSPDGICVFEVSYLMDVVSDTLFDTIYHEHLSYHAVKPLVEFFGRHGMELIDVERVATHGGSIRGTAQLVGGGREVSPRVSELVACEETLGLQSAGTFESLAARIDNVKASLSGLIRDLKAQGKTIAGFGAPAKATTLLYHLNLGGVLDFIVDDSPLKQNLFTPGHHIPVLPAQAIYDRRPGYVLVLAWNFAQSIMSNHKRFTEQGGRFILPMPEVRVV